MALLTQDNRTTTTFTANSRTGVGALTQDNRAYKFLWASTTFPWLEALPWQIQGIGNALTQDART